VSTIRNLSFISTLRDDQIAALEKMLKEFGDIVKNIEGNLVFFRRLFTGLSPRLPGFINREFYIGFLVD
jgi:hypothetical protein